MDIRSANEVYEQAVYHIEGTTFEVLQLMKEVDVDEYIEEVDSIKELLASIPVPGEYQYIKVTFSRGLTNAIADWDTDATDVVEPETWVNFLPNNEEQMGQLSPEQLYSLASANLVDVYSYTSFETPNILDGHVEILEG